MESQILNENLVLQRFKEDYLYNQRLQGLSLFPYNNIHSFAKVLKLVLNFNFKGIDFNKKKSLAFFLALELLTNQKCVATLSSKNILIWKLRKGMLVGCKVTLRKRNLYEFFDNLNIALPRMEKLQQIRINKQIKKNTNSVILPIKEVVFFYPIELGLGVNTEIKKLEINFIFNTTSKEEKLYYLRTNKIPSII